jgi:hypothetical protein
MIGCKNISPCKISSDNKIICIDWGIILKSNNIPENCKEI